METAQYGIARQPRAIGLRAARRTWSPALCQGEAPVGKGGLGGRRTVCRCLFEAALTDLARERDDLHALVDRHYEACRAELLASRDDADEDAGAAAALDAIDRQCRLVDQTAGAIQETLSGDVAAAAPRLLARADDVLGASRRLSERAASAAPTPSLRDVGRRRGVGDRLRAYLGAEASPARQDAPPPPPSPPSSPFGGDVERLVASLRDEVLSIRDEFRARDASSPPPARPATADAPPRTPLAPQSRPSPTGDARARRRTRALAGGREAPLSPLTDDRYADLLASSLRDVGASAARSSRRRGLLSSPEEAAAALTGSTTTGGSLPTNTVVAPCAAAG